MNKKTTLNNLTEFYKNEKELSQFLIDMESPNFSSFEKVNDQVISNILAYSRALSIRKSERLGTISFLLN